MDLVAIDADSKMILWRVGPRDLGTAYDLMHDLASRLSNRIQLTTDGLSIYAGAVESAFNIDVDYAMLSKAYGTSTGREAVQPGEDPGHDDGGHTGSPKPSADISTSYVERQNLTTHMSTRRFARLTNGFSQRLRTMRPR